MAQPSANKTLHLGTKPSCFSRNMDRSQESIGVENYIVCLNFSLFLSSFKVIKENCVQVETCFSSCQKFTFNINFFLFCLGCLIFFCW